MKKLIATLLVLALLPVCALAAGNLEVTKETMTVITTSYDIEGKLYAELTNTGDSAVQFDEGTFEMLDAEGNSLGERSLYSLYPMVLEAGEKAYLYTWEEVENAESAADVKSYTFKPNFRTSVYYAVTRYPAECAQEFIYDAYERPYVTAQITNNTRDTIWDAQIVFAVYDANDNLIYVSEETIYDMGILAGQALTVRSEVDEDLVKVWTENGTVPTRVEAIAYSED